MMLVIILEQNFLFYFLGRKIANTIGSPPKTHISSSHYSMKNICYFVPFAPSASTVEDVLVTIDKQLRPALNANK